MRKLQIVYDGPFDTELEQAIKELTERLGWEFLGSGYNFISNKRDIAYEKQQ